MKRLIFAVLTFAFLFSCGWSEAYANENAAVLENTEYSVYYPSVEGPNNALVSSAGKGKTEIEADIPARIHSQAIIEAQASSSVMDPAEESGTEEVLLPESETADSVESTEQEAMEAMVPEETASPESDGEISAQEETVDPDSVGTNEAEITDSTASQIVMGEEDAPEDAADETDEADEANDAEAGEAEPDDKIGETAQDAEEVSEPSEPDSTAEEDGQNKEETDRADVQGEGDTCINETMDGSPEEAEDSLVPEIENEEEKRDYSRFLLYAAGVGVALVVIIVAALVARKRKWGRYNDIQRTYQPDIPIDADYITVTYLSGKKRGCVDVEAMKDIYLVGTSTECDLSLEGTNIAEKHAKIYVNNGRLYIEDLDTDDGTYLNGMRLYSANRLRKDSVVTVGSVSFRIAY